jgi:hypothetical protein
MIIQDILKIYLDRIRLIGIKAKSETIVKSGGFSLPKFKEQGDYPSSKEIIISYYGTGIF